MNAGMRTGIRLGKVSSIDYPSGMIRVVYHEKDDDVTRLIPLLASEYAMPPVGAQVPASSTASSRSAGTGSGL